MITDFLLARIAEDETDATHVLDRLSVGSAILANQLRGYASRALAECEAKRRIVEMHVDGVGCTADSDAVCDACHYGVSPCHGDVLRTLAVVYADHPGYQQEWA